MIANKVYDRTNDAIKVITSDQAQEVVQIKNADDAVKTINFTDATKSVVDTIVTSSIELGKTVTETHDESGATIVDHDLINNATISDAVWDETTGDHTDSGSTGKKISDAEKWAKLGFVDK